MLVTNTDISIAWLRKKIAAPVIATLAKPSASGSAAAASEPNTASRISSTIGKPTCSADARSFLARSCMPAQSACWPTRWISTPASLWRPPPMPSSRRRSEAASAASSWVPLSWSGDDSDRRVGRRAWSGGRGGLRVERDVLDAVGAAADARDRGVDVGAGAAGAAREHDGELRALRAVEVGEAALDRRRAGARHLEAAARQVLGLACGERERGEQEHEPGRRHEPAVAPGEAVEPIHRRLHLVLFSSGWPASQPCASDCYPCYARQA